MPTPNNAPSSTTGGPERQDPELFAQLTERQAMPQTSQEIKGLGKKQTLIVEKVGIVARIRLLVEWKCEVTEEEKSIFNNGFPWRLLPQIAIESNGVTGIISCSAMALEARRRRIFRNPVSAILENPKKIEEGAKVKKEVIKGKFAIEIPIAHDMESLIGALLAQNEETSLSVTLQWANEEELQHAGKLAKLEGEVKWSTTVFAIGTAPIGKQEVTILPDLSAFHGLLEAETPCVGNGIKKANLIRTSGQLLCVGAAFQNGLTKELSPAAWTKFALEYGGNKDPLVWEPASELLELNADEYDGQIAIGVGGATEKLHYLFVDQEADNPSRDMIVPEQLTEFRAVFGLGAEAIEANANMIVTQETLYPAL